MGINTLKMLVKNHKHINDIKVLSFNMPLSGIVDNSLIWIGQEQILSSGLTANYSTVKGIQNNHIGIIVNSITAGGEILITGTKISETTAMPVTHTETLTVDDTDNTHYQTSSKWLEIISIDISNTTGIDYDIQILGYFNFGNTSWKLLGYRADIKTQSNTSDFSLKLEKIKDLGAGKHSHIILENYGHDSKSSSGDFIDNLRTGANDRSFTMSSNLAPNNRMIVYKMLDFDTYFTDKENEFNGSKNEGLIISLAGSPSGGISAIDHINLFLYYTN